MKIMIRKPLDTEFEAWSDLYRGYLDFYQTSLTLMELQKVWSWLFNKNNELNCHLAEIDEKIIGLAHFRKFIRPIKASCGVFLDDLYVLPEFRGKNVGYELIKSVKSYAKEHQIPLVRWITANDNQQAIKLYDAVANKTPWLTYDAKID